MKDTDKTRRPRSAAHARLGELLRRARVASSHSTRDLGYSSGHISNVERGHVTPSRELIQAYGALGLDLYAAEALLIEIENDARRARQDQIRAARSLPTPSNVSAPSTVSPTTIGSEVRRHYRIERYDVGFEFDERGAIVKVTSTAAIRAVSPAVCFYYAGHSPDESHRARPLPKVEVRAGGALERINLSPVGAWDMFFRLDRPIDPDDRSAHVLTYVVELSARHQADPAILYLAPPGAKQHRLDVAFTPPMLPPAVWWFAAADAFEADRPSSDRLADGEGGRYRRTFEPLVPGWYYGFTWTWPEL